MYISEKGTINTTFVTDRQTNLQDYKFSTVTTYIRLSFKFIYFSSSLVVEYLSWVSYTVSARAAAAVKALHSPQNLKLSRCSII